MSNQSQNGYKLRILSGPHSGAEITIGQGSYVLGKSEQSDIVLSDDGLAPQHAVITVSEGAFTLKSLAQPVKLAGGALDVNQQAVELKALQLVTVGDTRIAVGSTADDWSPLTPTAAPAPRLSVAAETQSVKSAAKPSAKRRLGAKLPSVTALLKPRRLYPLGAIAMLAACVMVVVVSTVNSKPVHRPLNDNIPLARVHRLISNLQLPPLNIETTEQGIIEIAGYVELTGQKNRLTHALRPLSDQIKVSVHSDEEILAAASAVLNSLGLSTVRVQKANAGKLYLEGYVEKQTNWSNARQVLEKDVSGITEIVDTKVDTLEKRLQALRRIIASHQLADKLQIVVDEGSLHVVGTLGKNELSAWHDVFHLYKERYGNQPKLLSKVNDRPELDLKLRSVSVGASPFIVTQSGGKYMEGSTLDNGYVLKSIQSDRIILSRNENDTVYYFGGEQ